MLYELPTFLLRTLYTRLLLTLVILIVKPGKNGRPLPPVTNPPYMLQLLSHLRETVGMIHGKLLLMELAGINGR